MADTKQQEDGMDVWDTAMGLGSLALLGRGAWKAAKTFKRLQKPGRIKRPIMGSGVVESAGGFALNEVRLQRQQRRKK